MPYNKYGEKIRRRFDPSEEPLYSSIPRSELVFYNTDKMIRQLRMDIRSKPNPIADESSLVVFIDGACRNNGRPAAQASYGVYFGPDSPHNMRGLLDASLPQTSTRAEIEALYVALFMICVLTHFDRTLTRVKIATDSSFLVKAMSQWIGRWIKDGGVGSSGRQVAHFQVLRTLHEQLDRIGNGINGVGREIQLWHVPGK